MTFVNVCWSHVFPTTNNSANGRLKIQQHPREFQRQFDHGCGKKFRRAAAKKLTAAATAVNLICFHLHNNHFPINFGP